MDFFSGSGTTGIATYKLGRNYMGIEREKEYLDLSIKRYEDFCGSGTTMIETKLLNRYGAVLIGDIRKNKNVIPLGFYIMNIFIETGFTLKVIIKEQHNCKRTDCWNQNKNRNFYLLAHE